MSDLGIPAKMHRLHAALTAAEIPHAFGGALALAWCVNEVRATMDIDLNILVDTTRIDDALAALPREVSWTPADEEGLHRDGQARLRWDRHPIDVFFNTTGFHARAADRVRWEHLGGGDLPFLACNDLAVFKAFFARGKDWVDLEAMALAGALDRPVVAGVLADHLGPDDPRVARVLALGHADTG